MTRNIRTYSQVTEDAGAELIEQVVAQESRLHARLATVRNVVVVASGKGGVGKSFIAAHLAAGLAELGYRTGALDADINGPSLALMLNADRAALRVDHDGVQPARGRNNCTVMSSDLLLDSANAPVRWREPATGAFIWQSTLETGTLREFISDVAWGELDALIIDLPPGTDKIARILSLLPSVSALLMVMTPSYVTNAVVQRSLTQVNEAGVSQVGIVMNMATFACPACGVSSGFLSSAADIPARDVWASIPFEPAAAQATDHGEALPHESAAARAIEALVTRVEQLLRTAP